jgi:transposase InsO family protein
MPDSHPPTERDRFWLDHEAALAASDQTAKAYAAEQGLSLHALYQARKRLRALGLLPPSRSRRRPSKPEPPSVAFSKVELASPPAMARPDFRLSLPNGLVLEWSGAELPEAVVELVERLTRPQ